jgi:2-oxoglutarate dehydrogenase E2 component (dihydrolipoamide succinyltransferase)
MIALKLPPFGESITEVVIAKWLKKDGDTVKIDEVVAEVETDKATMELTATAAGTLKIVVPEGTTTTIGTVVAHIAETQATTNTPNTTTPQTTINTQKSMAGEKIMMTVPPVGESINEVIVGNWTKKDGDFVKLDETICEIESDKATFEVTAKANGILKIIAQKGTTLKIGDQICEITVTEATAQKPTTQTPATTTATTTANTNYAQGHASPAAGKILSEKGIATEEVKGTGKDGRITKEDALNAQKTTPQVQTPTPVAPTPTAAPATTGGNRGTRREKMTSLRKTVARRLVAVKNETAMLTTFNEVDMKPIMDLRAKYKETFHKKHEIGLGFMSFFVKACCIALKEFPAVNAYIDGDEIVFNDYVDMSVAVSAPKGLVVPVIRNAEAMSFSEIEKAIATLATKARENKLSIPEMTGGTFTITNGGVFGSMLSTPIINAPQSAILGMHNIVERAVVQNGEVVVRPIMYVALSYDHRIIDGRESVGFLVRVKQLLEDPARMLLAV